MLKIFVGMNIIAYICRGFSNNNYKQNICAYRNTVTLKIKKVKRIDGIFESNDRRRVGIVIR